MSEVQETGTSRKIEHIEKSQSSSSKTRKLYVLGVAFVAVLLLGASFGMMLSATTPSIPTVIEPGSNVVGASYVVFKDGSNYYARNGTTGAIDYSSTNALTFLNQVIDLAPQGGVINLGPADYLWSGANYLLIDKPGLTFIGAASSPMIDASPSPHATPTKLGGNITIISENVRMETLNIGGTLTITSNDAHTIATHWLRFMDVFIGDGVAFVGVAGAGPWYLPFNIIFEGGKIEKTGSGPVFMFDNPGAGGLDHISFNDMTVYSNVVGGDIITMKGLFDNIVWTNTLFLMYGADQTFLNMSYAAGGGSYFNGITFTNAYIEVGATGCTLLSFIDYLHATQICVKFIGGVVQSVYNLHYIINDNSYTTGSYLANKSIIFDAVYFSYPGPLNFVSSKISTSVDASMPVMHPTFVNCQFRPGAALRMDDNPNNWLPSESVGLFRNCYNLNPFGTVTTPFWFVNADSNVHGAITICESDHDAYHPQTTAPATATNYTARDVDYLITSTGGTVSNIIVWDTHGVVVLTGSTTLSHYYLPWGYAIQWTYSAAPTVIVEGL